MKTPNQNTLNKAATALLKPNAVEHKRPKEPTKADLNKKFVMRLDRKGNPAIKEVSLFCQVKGIIPKTRIVFIMEGSRHTTSKLAKYIYLRTIQFCLVVFYA